MATNAARKKTNPAETADSPITILKDATCPTSSGKSTLGYAFGSNEKGDLQFKLTSNSGGGHFTSSWISFKDVQAALKAWPQDQPVTSMALRPLSRGKSANDAGFACAVLVAEGFLVKVAGKSRVHEAISPTEFRAKVEALKAGGGMQAKTSARKPRAKASARAKPAPKAKSPRKPASKTPRKAVKKTP